VCGQQSATGFAKRMLVPNRICEHRRIEDDHAGLS
jgi:hypothetical protein